MQNSQNNVPCGWGVFVRDTVGKHTYAVPPVPLSYNNNCAAYNSPSISGDGSVVAFQASVPKTSTRTTTKTYNDQIYIADMCWSGGCTPASTLISREASAFTSSSLTGAGDSTAPSISADGRKVAFVSTAYDLTDTLYWTPAISKTPAVPANIYSASTCAGSDSCVPASTLVSVGVTNGQAGLANNISASPAISNDGRYVAYNSSATNLVNGVGTTLVLGIGNGSAQQAFLNDQCTGTTAPSGCVGSTLLASSTPPGIPAIPSGAAPGANSSAIGDGGVVAFNWGTIFQFSSTGTSYIGASDATAARQFVCVGLSCSISASPPTLLASSLPTPANDASLQSATSSDGRFVAFASYGTNLAPSAQTSGSQQIYLRDTCYGQSPYACTPSTTLISADRSGNPGSCDSSDPAISGKGQIVTFDSGAPNLLPGSSSGSSGSCGTRQVYVYNACGNFIFLGGSGGRCGATLTLASQSPGSAPGNNDSSNSSLSTDGTYLAYQTQATNLSSALNENSTSQVVVEISAAQAISALRVA